MLELWRYSNFWCIARLFYWIEPTGDCPASPASTPASGTAGHNFIRNTLATVRRHRRCCPAFNQKHTGNCPAVAAVCPAPDRKFCQHTGACLASPAVCPAVCLAPQKRNLNPISVCPAAELSFWNTLAVVRHCRRRRERNYFCGKFVGVLSIDIFCRWNRRPDYTAGKNWGCLYLNFCRGLNSPRGKFSARGR